MKKNILQKLKDLPLSPIAHTIYKFSNIKYQLIQSLKNHEYFSLALDESYKIRDTIQSIPWIFSP